MSEVVRYKGLIAPVPKNAGEELEEQCKRIAGGIDLPKWVDSYREYLELECRDKYIVVNDRLFRFEMLEDVDPYESHCTINRKDDMYEFDTTFYDGGCSLNEMLDEAFEEEHGEK